MIRYRFVREKELLLDYARALRDTQAEAIINFGTIETEDDARALAKFFWRMVDVSLDDDIKDWHEQILNTLMGACARAGFGDAWDDELPAD